MKAALTAMAKPGGDVPAAAASVLSTLLNTHATLRLVRFIPVLVNMHQWVHTAFMHRVSQEEAIDLTVADSINLYLEPHERAMARHRLQEFLDAWAVLQRTLDTYGVDCHSQVRLRLGYGGLLGVVLGWAWAWGAGSPSQMRVFLFLFRPSHPFNARETMR